MKIVNKKMYINKNLFYSSNIQGIKLIRWSSSSSSNGTSSTAESNKTSSVLQAQNPLFFSF